MVTVVDAGDVAHVRRTAAEEPLEIAEGEVTAIDEAKVTLGSREYVYADGWTVELVARAPQNLHLPDTLAEIVVYSRFAPTVPVRVMGKADQWRRVDNGKLIPVSHITDWHEPEA